ncbi:MAG: GTP-binding protein, partial [Candidatus Aminicenantes bacterium]|nr:GTP-binding protein [Candidatus Aminicenantes bacterium]
MRDYIPEQIRNVALVGHGSCGKTSLTAAFLFVAGVTPRLTKVDKGNTITDFEPEEIDRKISISAACCFLEWKGCRLNLIDTPGYHNFLWDTKASLRAVDAAAIVVCGVAGVEVGTEKTWDMIEELDYPRLFIINKLDRENSNFYRTLEEIHQFFGRKAVPIQIPIGEEKDFIGVIDLIKQRAFIFEKDESGQFREEDIPANFKEEAKKKREQLIEMIAENDETLMEKYFEKGDLTEEEIKAGLKKAVLEKQIFPVMGCSALFNLACQPILDYFVELLPSPLERPPLKVFRQGNEQVWQPSLDSPFAALVFKTLSDPYTGRISIMRVFSGRVNPDVTVINTTRDCEEKLGGLFYLQGKEQVPAGQAKLGDIVATSKLKMTTTGAVSYTHL